MSIEHTEQHILNQSFDNEHQVIVTEAVRRNAGNTALEFYNPATEANQTNGTQISKAYLTDENGVQMLGDGYFAGAPVVVDVAHHELHCGDSICLTHTVDLTNGAVRDILITVPNPAITAKRYHFYIEVTTESETDVKLYESTTTSNNGTTIAAFNRNRQDPVVAENEVVFTHTPTVTGVGTLIEEFHFGSGRGVGGENRGNNEWVFKNNTKYLLRVTNATTTNNYIAVKIDYYVHPGQ
jgi:hypothetical protein